MTESPGVQSAGQATSFAISCLQCINNAQNFVEITANRHWVGHNETNFLVRVDNKYRANRCCGTFVRVNHVVFLCHFQLFVGNNWKLQNGILSFVNIVYPAFMCVN